jgi:hypothetical protein
MSNPSTNKRKGRATEEDPPSKRISGIGIGAEIDQYEWDTIEDFPEERWQEFLKGLEQEDNAPAVSQGDVEEASGCVDGLPRSSSMTLPSKPTSVSKPGDSTTLSPPVSPLSTSAAFASSCATSSAQSGKSNASESSYAAVPPKLNTDGPIRCEHPGCQRTFENNYQLKSHARSHIPFKDRPFDCEYCNMRFLYESQIDKHVEKVHEKVPEGYCYKCGKPCFWKKNFATT